MGGVRPVQVVILLPLGKTRLEVDIALIFEQLIEFGLVGTMGTFHLAVEPRCVRLDIYVVNAQILQVPMELGLKFVAVVGADHANPERELGPDVIDKLDRVRLGVTPVDL